MSEKAPFMVFSGTNSRYLAEKICASLDCPLGNMNITHFADGEFAVSYEESIRGAHVFLVQSTFPNSDNLMELLLMIDAAKRASAKSVVAVVLCIVSMFLIYIGLQLFSAYVFGLALILLIASLGVSFREIQISTRSLEIYLGTMEKGKNQK